eukprot:scaffold5295_cov390-Prasinococcus_capsulatus_cf.AAC.7
MSAASIAALASHAGSGGRIGWSSWSVVPPWPVSLLLSFLATLAYIYFLPSPRVRKGAASPRSRCSGPKMFTGAPALEVSSPSPLLSESPAPTRRRHIAIGTSQTAESILSHTRTTFCVLMRTRLGVGDVLARQFYKEFYKCGSVARLSVDACRARPSVERMLSIVDLGLPLLLKESSTEGPRVQPPQQGTAEKYVLQGQHHGSAVEVEMVTIPATHGQGKWSLCISSQVGCRMGCRFCETGRMGYIRNLSVAEIVSQVFHARFTL